MGNIKNPILNELLYRVVESLKDTADLNKDLPDVLAAFDLDARVKGATYAILVLDRAMEVSRYGFTSKKPAPSGAVVRQARLKREH